MGKNPSPDPLEGFRAKLNRAREHLRVLEASVGGFFVEGETYTITRQPNPKPEEFVFRVDVIGKPPLIEWSLLIGDCIHNIRSALDHLFWAILLVRHPRGIRDSQANFPLIRDPNTFKGRKAKLKQWVGPEVTALLEAFQPYNAPDPDVRAMSFVHESDIRDKHKLLIPVLWASPKGTLDIERTNEDVSVVDVAFKRRTEGDAIFLTFVIAPHHSIVDVKLKASVGIVFGVQAGEGPTVTESLKQFLEIAEAVGRKFGPFAYATHNRTP